MYRKCAILFLFLAFFIKSNGQVYNYLPDGKEIFIQGETYQSFFDSLGLKTCDLKVFLCKKAQVIFRGFVNEPVLIKCEQKINKREIERIIKECSYEKYLLSSEFDSDLRFSLAEKYITKKYLQSIYKGNSIEKNASGEWLIKAINTKFIFEKDIAITSEKIEDLAAAEIGFAFKTYAVRAEFGSTLGFEFTLINLYNKAIKFIFIKAASLDNDFTIFDRKTISDQSIVKPNESHFYSYREVFNTTLYHLTIESITIEYADGTKKVIEQKDIQTMIRECNKTKSE